MSKQNHIVGRENRDREFLKRLNEACDRILAERKPTDTDDEIANRIADCEQELMIRLKLGNAFPPEKREAMLRAHRTMRQARDEALVQRSKGSIAADAYVAALQAAVDDLMQQYASILNAGEFKKFCEQEPGGAITVPIDPRLIKVK